MKLYNTLTRTVQDFALLRDNTVRFYSCGPTVYDHAHIGNLRAYIFADTLHRTLEASGYTVKRVMNYTDIDDKTVSRSQQKYPDDEPMLALKKLTQEYIELFHADMQKIGNRTDNVTFMAATDYIPQMQTMITKLHKNGFAYIADDGVYFSIDAYKKSGKTYGQLLNITAASTSEARIQNDEYDKESVHDFALWKTQKPGEPAWSFTLGGRDLTGRPGWHIECSAMSHEGVGQPFDLHTGGVDNIFPHHENEIAQSTAGEENPTMARFFTHNEHLLVDGKKMSKSANNFYTLEDVIKQGYDPLAFRLLILQSHYHSQAQFSFANLEAAQNRLQSFRAMADLRFQVRNTNGEHPSPDYVDYQQSVTEAMQQDLDAPAALAILSGAETASAEPPAGTGDAAQKFTAFLEAVDNLLGLGLLSSQDITGQQKSLIAEREKARAAEDWQRADELRSELLNQGIGLRDTALGAIWFRQLLPL